MFYYIDNNESSDYDLSNEEVYSSQAVDTDGAAVLKTDIVIPCNVLPSAALKGAPNRRDLFRKHICAAQLKATGIDMFALFQKPGYFDPTADQCGSFSRIMNGSHLLRFVCASGGNKWRYWILALTSQNNIKH